MEEEKIITATLGKYTANVKVKVVPGMDLERFQDMVNRRVAEMYLEDYLTILRGQLKFLIDEHAKEKEVLSPLGL